MGLEPNSISTAILPASVSVPPPTSATVSASPTGKRSRDPEDEVYLDKFHSQKRYLSEVMASSLNGLTVGDTLPDNFIESSARSESMFYLRDESSSPYSPMSEESDDTRSCDTPLNTGISQPESLPSSPVSPSRYQRSFTGVSSSSPIHPYSSQGCNLTGTTTFPQPRQRGSEPEGRFPSSPSDICHSADLRRAALLRSVQMRAHPSAQSLFGLSLGAGQELVSNIEAEEQSYSGIKSLVDEREYQIDECSALGISPPSVFSVGEPYQELNMNVEREGG